MRSGYHSYPGVQFVAWNVIKEKLNQIYFSYDLFEITHNFYSTRGATVISGSLRNHVYTVQ